MEWHQRLGCEVVRFGGYETVLESPADDNREHNFIIIMDSAVVWKVCQWRTYTKCQCWDYICGPSKTDQGCYAAYILGITKGMD